MVADKKGFGLWTSVVTATNKRPMSLKQQFALQE
jgi:uncharacterized coiled-coil protein SlyX